MPKTDTKPDTCIVCGSKNAGERLRRGLCEAHYQRFRRALARIPEDKQDDFEQSLIDDGKLLPSKQGQRVTDDVFAAAAAAFMEEAKSLEDEAVAEAEKRKRKAKKKSSK